MNTAHLIRLATFTLLIAMTACATPPRTRTLSTRVIVPESIPADASSNGVKERIYFSLLVEAESMAMRKAGACKLGTTPAEARDAALQASLQELAPSPLYGKNAQRMTTEAVDAFLRQPAFAGCPWLLHAALVHGFDFRSEWMAPWLEAARFAYVADVLAGVRDKSPKALVTALDEHVLWLESASDEQALERLRRLGSDWEAWFALARHEKTIFGFLWRHEKEYAERLAALGLQSVQSNFYLNVERLDEPADVLVTVQDPPAGAPARKPRFYLPIDPNSVDPWGRYKVDKQFHATKEKKGGVDPKIAMEDDKPKVGVSLGGRTVEGYYSYSIEYEERYLIPPFDSFVRGLDTCERPVLWRGGWWQVCGAEGDYVVEDSSFLRSAGYDFPVGFAEDLVLERQKVDWDEITGVNKQKEDERKEREALEKLKSDYEQKQMSSPH